MVNDCKDCGFPHVSQLLLSSSCFVGKQDSVPNIQTGTMNLFVVEVGLMFLLSCILLGYTSSFMKACHQFAGVGAIVNHIGILQDLLENHVHRESRDSTEHQVEWAYPVISCTVAL